MKRGVLPVIAVAASFLAVFLWLYVQFLAPRMTAPLAVKIALPIVVVILIAIRTSALCVAIRSRPAPNRSSGGRTALLT